MNKDGRVDPERTGKKRGASNHLKNDTKKKKKHSGSLLLGLGFRKEEQVGLGLFSLQQWRLLLYFFF